MGGGRRSGGCGHHVEQHEVVQEDEGVEVEEPHEVDGCVPAAAAGERARARDQAEIRG